MILIDYLGHIVSTKNAEELHRFARKLGLRKGHYQKHYNTEYHAHYDLTTVLMRMKAKRLGAIEVKPKEIIAKAWWAVRSPKEE